MPELNSAKSALRQNREEKTGHTLRSVSYTHLVHVEEPSEEETLEILKGLRPLYEKHHGVTISDEALEAAVKLSVRYINDPVSYTQLDVYKRQGYTGLQSGWKGNHCA